ncbi:ShlB/FhaC/HecB family hemolysin secretion/activation protein [Desertifilum tharense IPPAS B-1220]|uniref:Peptide transporter n=2 Tax=Desertifilum TaxID=1185872 RepID=A0A1E5QP57_9CYAN|nr:ShlB/FhaC/HecB family hemolysin secretion/activation protein [Desertifilum tharense]OEJ76401.1 peptide transporter [Desertifilum tharense IPPAS B-1220]
MLEGDRYDDRLPLIQTSPSNMCSLLFWGCSQRAALILLTSSTLLGVMLGNSQGATAQTSIPPTRLEDVPPPPLPSDFLPPPVESPPLLPPPTLPDTPTLGDPSARFLVEQIEVVGSTVFSAEQFAEITAPFIGRELSFAELLQIRDAIAQLYIENGYITTGAIIPPQVVEGGTVTIQVVEGRLEEINIVGNRRLRPHYIRDRIRLGAQTPLNVPRLLEALQLLRLDPRLQNLSAELQSGVRPGTNILQVEVDEADTFRLTGYLDNGRSPSVGSFRRGVELQELNLLGFGDTLSLGYANTNGSNTLDFNYTLPVNARNGSIWLGFSQGWNRVIEEPFSVLDIQSNTRSYEIGYRQPIVQKPTEELALGLLFSRQFSQTELGIDNIGPFPLSPGADERGRTKISAFRFFQEYVQRSNEQVFALRSQFNLGVGLFDATVNQDAPDSRFFAWRGQAQWVRQFSPDSLFLVRGDLQLSANSLVPLEQFGLGGQLNVRGYRQDALLTDNGVLLSAEYRIPVVRVPRVGGVLQVVPFFDLGKGWNQTGDNPSPSLLAGTGVGLLWRQGDNLSVRLDWGLPLTSIDSEKRSLQENGFYFSVRYSPF